MFFWWRLAMSYLILAEKAEVVDKRVPLLLIAKLN